MSISLDELFKQSSGKALAAFAKHWESVSGHAPLTFKEGLTLKAEPKYLMEFHGTYIGVFKTNDLDYAILPVRPDRDYFHATLDLECDVVCRDGYADVTSSQCSHTPHNVRPEFFDVSEQLGATTVRTGHDRVADNLNSIKKGKS